jgi:ABC-type antimicrobial peptide transport system permease subunit
VGIVSDAAFQPLDQTPVVPDFFTPYAQFTYAARAVLVRTQGDPMSLAAGVARAVSRANPNLALFDVQTMEARAGMSWATHTFQTWLLDVFAAIALLLAATGIYAVTAHFVVARTKELGIRIALGATSTDVVRASMSRTVRLGVFGLLIGIAGAIAASRVLTAFLYETSPLDVRVFVGVGGALMVVLACASYLPVRKALRVNPVEALRAE